MVLLDLNVSCIQCCLEGQHGRLVVLFGDPLVGESLDIIWDFRQVCLEQFRNGYILRCISLGDLASTLKESWEVFSPEVEVFVFGRSFGWSRILIPISGVLLILSSSCSAICFHSAGFSGSRRFLIQEILAALRNWRDYSNRKKVLFRNIYNVYTYNREKIKTQS